MLTLRRIGQAQGRRRGFKGATVSDTGSGGASSVTSVSRDAGSAAGGVSLTIRGTGFTGSPVVLFGSAAATSVAVVNSTTITCVAPAYVGTPAVGGSLVTISVANASLSSAFEYHRTASSLSLTNGDFETDLGDFGTDAPHGTVAVSTDAAYSGSKSAKCAITSPSGGGARAALEKAYGNNPPASLTNGLYERVYVNVPSSVIAHIISNSRQIKLHIFRVDGSQGVHNGWFMFGIGADFPPADGTLVIFSDFDTGGTLNVQTNVAFGDGVWVEIQTWQQYSGGVGRGKVWVNGLEVGSITHASFGSSNASASFDSWWGCAYAESSSNVTVYLDKRASADGFIDP